MTGRLPFDQEQALDNLNQAVNYLTNLNILLPQTLSTDLDVLRLMRCFGHGKATYQLWNRLRASPIPAHADGLILGLILPMATQLATIREGLKQPPFSSDAKCVHQATILGGAAHGVLVRLVRLVGVRTIDTELQVLDEWLDYARASRDENLFEWCLSQRLNLYARCRPDLDATSLNQIERAAWLKGQAPSTWPVELVPLLCLWAGESENMDEYASAFGFGEAALRFSDRAVAREDYGQDDLKSILSSAIFLSRQDAIQRGFDDSLEGVGKAVRTRQSQEAISALSERTSQRVARTKIKIEIQPLDESISSTRELTDPLTEIAEAETSREIRDAVENLPPAQRRAVLTLQRSLDEGRPLRHYFETEREYKTAHDHIRAARRNLPSSLLTDS